MTIADNNLAPFSPEFWSKRMQAYKKFALIGNAIANYEERETLSVGTDVHRPYSRVGSPQQYTKNVGISNVQAAAGTDEKLTVNKNTVLPVFVDKEDIKQNKYKTAIELTDQAIHKIKKTVDSQLLTQYDVASQSFDGSDMGSSGGIALGTSNVAETIVRSLSKMRSGGVKADDPTFVAFDPMSIAELTLKLMSVGFKNADEMVKGNRAKNGFFGRFFNTSIFESENLTWTGKFTPSANFTNGQTIIIGGVTATAKTDPEAAGEFDIGANLAASLDNLVALFANSERYAASAGLATTYFEFTQENRNLLYGLSVTDGASYITVEFEGNSTPNPGGTGGAWSLGLIHALAGKYGCIDQVIQSEVDLEIVPNPINPATGNLMIGEMRIPQVIFGTKAFKEGRDRMIDIQISHGNS